LVNALMAVVAAGAGFAGDRVDPAVALARSGLVDCLVLECLAERTIVQGLRARQLDPAAGYDRRLRRRLTPLLPPAAAGCRIVTNLGSANPAAAAAAVAGLATELGLPGLRIAGVLGDDVMGIGAAVRWSRDEDGEWLGIHAYLGMDPIVDALQAGADVVVTGRAADAALFAAPLRSTLDGGADAVAGALAVGHLLECSGQLTGGNFDPPGERGLAAADYASLGFPMAEVAADGTAQITKLAGTGGRIDRMTCTLQLLYEVHDPRRYITPDAIVDFSGITFEQLGADRVRVSGARSVGVPADLKVSGFVQRPGAVADVEIGFAGVGALRRAQLASETLRLRLEMLGVDEFAVDVVGVDSILGPISAPVSAAPPEARAHVSAACESAELAQVVEDEVYALTLSGPAAGAALRSEMRPRVAVVDGLLARESVKPELVWEVST
jgi:Acyclic terpene utilisation family protein AtuA